MWIFGQYAIALRIHRSFQHDNRLRARLKSCDSSVHARPGKAKRRVPRPRDGGFLQPENRLHR